MNTLRSLIWSTYFHLRSYNCSLIQNAAFNLNNLPTLSPGLVAGLCIRLAFRAGQVTPTLRTASTILTSISSALSLFSQHAIYQNDNSTAQELAELARSWHELQQSTEAVSDKLALTGPVDANFLVGLATGLISLSSLRQSYLKQIPTLYMPRISDTRPIFVQLANQLQTVCASLEVELEPPKQLD